MSNPPLSDDLSTPAESGTTDPALDALQRERDELLDRLLRTTAEFDNYRKRTERERRDHAEWAAADLLREVLAVIDDFERALAVPSPPEAKAYRDGVELIHRQLLDLLRKRGVAAIDTAGHDFDPAVHQAVAHDEVPGAREGEIVDELRRGYRLGDRLLRPAMVRVAKAS
jgi:molecular chaperone GrpE